MNKTYSGSEVNEIISIILDEADNSIEAAYKEGYKQAKIELEPEVEYWKTLYQSYKYEPIKDTIKWTLIGFGTGFLIGGVSGFTLGLKINFN